MLPDSARAVIESDALAHLVTLDRDGTPYVTIAWVGLEGDDIVFATLSDQRKLRNLRREPRVVLSLQTDRTNQIGLREYLVIYGAAQVVEGGAPERGSQARSSGVGLGLHIARSLADSIGGRIDASTGDGTVEFVLSLPSESRVEEAAPVPG